MSIDAELAAGHINDKEARARRQGLERETDFYGAMDGASKFVRGDAVAAIVITAVNIVGGFLVGVLQQGMDVAHAAKVYTVLSVGDGLVSQLPALLVSSAAGILSTRSASGSALGPMLSKEMFSQDRPLTLASIVLGGLGLMPGMPHVIYLGLAGVLAYGARRAKDAQRVAVALEEAPKPAPAPVRNEVEESLQLGLIDLEVGFDLVPLVDQAKGGEIPKKIQGLRKQLAQELGIVVPAINIRDNLLLKPGVYRVLLSGNEVGRSELRVGRVMAMSASGRNVEIGGEPTREPAFGIEARWIALSDRDRVERLGFTTVDCATVLATHLSELIRQNAPELFGRKEAQQIFDLFSAQYPKVLEELVPNMMSAMEVVKVLRLLLREGQSIRDMRTIVEALLENAHVKDPEQLTELVRQKMSRHISGRFRGNDGRVHGLFLDPQVEEVFRQLQRGTASPDPNALGRIMKALEEAMVGLRASAHAPVLVTAPDVRRSVQTLVGRYFPGLNVISLREIDQRTEVVSLGVVA
jgi:flagellar biosynthesis protein FlhA